jgi:hypothetical protein
VQGSKRIAHCGTVPGSGIIDRKKRREERRECGEQFDVILTNQYNCTRVTPKLVSYRYHPRIPSQYLYRSPFSSLLRCKVFSSVMINGLHCATCVLPRAIKNELLKRVAIETDNFILSEDKQRENAQMRTAKM